MMNMTKISFAFSRGKANVKANFGEGQKRTVCFAFSRLSLEGAKKAKQIGCCPWAV